MSLTKGEYSGVKRIGMIVASEILENYPKKQLSHKNLHTLKNTSGQKLT